MLEGLHLWDNKFIQKLSAVMTDIENKVNKWTTAENARVVSENTLVAAEKVRETAEAERIANEKQRVTDFDAAQEERTEEYKAAEAARDAEYGEDVQKAVKSLNVLFGDTDQVNIEYEKISGTTKTINIPGATTTAAGAMTADYVQRIVNLERKVKLLEGGDQ